MTPISPLDALGPAFARTREVLGQPFRFLFFLKIALIAALTQPSFMSSLISYPMQAVNYGMMGHSRGQQNFMPPTAAASLSPAVFGVGILLVAILAIFLLIWVALAYLSCRLR